MNYRPKKFLGEDRIVTGYHIITDKEDALTLVIMSTLQDCKERVKEGMLEHLKKMTIDNGYSLQWNEGDAKIELWKDIEYSNIDEYDSEKIRTLLVVIHGKEGQRKRTDFVHSNWRINEQYEGEHLECGFTSCGKKTLKLYKSHLLDEARTEILVCSKCQKDLKIMKNLVEEIEAKKKIEK